MRASREPSAPCAVARHRVLALSFYYGATLPPTQHCPSLFRVFFEKRGEGCRCGPAWPSQRRVRPWRGTRQHDSAPEQSLLRVVPPSEGCGRVIREIFNFFTEVCRQQVPREAKRPANRLHPANILRFQPAKQAEAPPPASSSAYFGEKQAKNVPDPSRHPKQATPLVVKPLTTRGVSKSFLLNFRVFFNI